MGRKPVKFNTIGLTEGMVVNSYDELCYLLGIKPINNRKQQLERISKEIEIEKLDCHRYKIIRVRNVHKGTRVTNENKTKIRKDAKYVGLGYKILLKYIIDADGKYICDNNELIIALGLGNGNPKENIIYEGLLYFHNTVRSIAEGIVHGCIFDGLYKRRKLIHVDDVYYYTVNNKPKKASKAEQAAFVSILNETLDKYNIPSYSRLFYGKQTDKSICKKAEEELYNRIQTELGWMNFTKKYCLSSPEYLYEDIQIDSVRAEREKMNALMIDKVRTIFLKKGREYFNYNPDYSPATAIGNAVSVSQKGYEEYCRNLEILIDKYIRI